MITDLRYALRLLAKSPWFTSLTVLVLAGGLAISIYTYAALNMMIYRDVPLPDGGSIVRDRLRRAGRPSSLSTRSSWPELRAQSRECRRARRLPRLACARRRGRRKPQRPGRSSRTGGSSSSRAFSLCSAAASCATTARPEPSPLPSSATRPGSPPSQATPSVVGTLARINGQLTRIVGVMPEGYAIPDEHGHLAAASGGGARTGRLLRQQGSNAYARLRPGVSVGNGRGRAHRVGAAHRDSRSRTPTSEPSTRSRS